MKIRKFALVFLVTTLFALPSACSFNTVSSLFVTPTATSTNTPLPTSTPTIAPTSTPTSTATPSPTPAPSWNPGVGYDNDKFGFLMVFPNGTQIEPMELTDTSGLPSSLAGLVHSFMIGRAGPVGIFGFSSTNSNLLPKSMKDIITTVASNLPDGQISTSIFSNINGVELGRIDSSKAKGDDSTAIYFKSKHVLVYFTFIYNAIDKQTAETIISESVDTIQLK